MGVYSLDIVTPGAAHGATLEEYCRPDSGSIFNRESLDIGDESHELRSRHVILTFQLDRTPDRDMDIVQFREIVGSGRQELSRM